MNFSGATRYIIYRASVYRAGFLCPSGRIFGCGVGRREKGCQAVLAANRNIGETELHRGKHIFRLSCIVRCHRLVCILFKGLQSFGAHISSGIRAVHARVDPRIPVHRLYTRSFISRGQHALSVSWVSYIPPSTKVVQAKFGAQTPQTP